MDSTGLISHGTPMARNLVRFSGEAPGKYVDLAAGKPHQKSGLEQEPVATESLKYVFASHARHPTAADLGHYKLMLNPISLDMQVCRECRILYDMARYISQKVKT